PSGTDRGDAAERSSVLTQVQQLGVADELFCVERDESIGGAERERPDEDTAYGTEDRGVRADAKRQCDGRDDREPRPPNESTNRVPQVANQIRHQPAPVGTRA